MFKSLFSVQSAKDVQFTFKYYKHKQKSVTLQKLKQHKKKRGILQAKWLTQYIKFPANLFSAGLNGSFLG